MGWSRRPQSHCHPETDPPPNNRPCDYQTKHTSALLIIPRRHRRTRTQTKCKKCKTGVCLDSQHWWLNVCWFSASVSVLPDISDQMIRLNATHHITLPATRDNHTIFSPCVFPQLSHSLELSPNVWPSYCIYSLFTSSHCRIFWDTFWHQINRLDLAWVCWYTDGEALLFWSLAWLANQLTLHYFYKTAFLAIPRWIWFSQ